MKMFLVAPVWPPAADALTVAYSVQQLGAVDLPVLGTKAARQMAAAGAVKPC